MRIVSTPRPQEIRDTAKQATPSLPDAPATRICIRGDPCRTVRVHAGAGQGRDGILAFQVGRGAGDERDERALAAEHLVRAIALPFNLSKCKCKLFACVRAWSLPQRVRAVACA
jgi:hypothetical protein